MVFIDQILLVERNHVVTQVTFGPDHYATDESGRIEGSSLIEALAECAAIAAYAQSRAHSDKPEMGMLVGVRDFEVRQRVEVGQLLEISIEIIRQLDPFQFANGKVTRNGKVLAAGELTLYINSTDTEE